MNKTIALIALALTTSIYAQQAPQAQQAPTPDPVVSQLTETEQLKLKSYGQDLENILLKGQIVQTNYQTELAKLQSQFDESNATLNSFTDSVLKSHNLVGKFAWDQKNHKFVSLNLKAVPTSIPEKK